jgi:DNA-binding beta-propeller fold protein YncE
MNARRLILVGLALPCATVGLALSSTLAQAALVHPYLSQLTGTSAGPFSEILRSVAVDPASQDVYVADEGKNAIDVFNSVGEYQSEISGTETPAGFFSDPTSVAVNDTTGDVYVASDTGGIYVFDALGSYVSTMDGSGTPAGSFPGFPLVAVDQSSGDVYVADEGVVDRFNSADEYQSQLTGFSNLSGLATGASGDVYVAERGSGGVYEFSPSGSQIVHITGTPNGSFGELTGVAVDSAGRLYVSDAGQGIVDEFDPAGSFLGQITGSSSPKGSFSYPAGVAVNASGSVYVADIDFVDNSPGVVDVFAPTRPEAPSIESESVSNVGSSNATIEAQIDPDSDDTHYYFQYGTVSCTISPSSCTEVPSSPGTDIGAGEDERVVSAELQGLQSGTTYHYRVVAHNTLGTLEGPDETFVTQAAGGVFSLPDGRAWEMVSPLDKHGAGIESIGNGGIVQASEDGTAITYQTIDSTEADPAGNRAPDVSQILSTRGAGGWSTRDITTENESITRSGGGTNRSETEYQLFSSDLSLGMVDPFGHTPLSSMASERTIYLRNDATCEATPATCYRPLVTAANVQPSAKFGGSLERGVNFRGATPDFTHIVLSSDEALTSEAKGEKFGLYEWAEGNLRFVNVLPDGEPSREGHLGAGDYNVRHAISNDGSRIFWSESEARSHLYMRDMKRGETIQIDAAQGVEEPTAEPTTAFQTASADGSKVFFTNGQKLTKDSTADPTASGGAGLDLYECEVVEVAGKLACKLTDLTVDEHAGEHAAVQGSVLGASEDGSYVYFVANGALAPGATHGACNGQLAPTATCNLYVRHDGATTFIAALSGEDHPDWEGQVNNGQDLGRVTSRVSPNGRYLAFMSERDLTGYDNHDANSGAPDEEVYLYDASSNRVVCASCNPTGARPVGVPDTEGSEELLVDQQGLWRIRGGRWLAGSIPGWTGGNQLSSFYQSRYLSDSGRLFFDSADALVPQDTNGVEDVYEYEPEGEGGCNSSGTTFSERSGGCVGLISSGTSSEESAFLDASVSGDDVFFITSQQLVSQDYDTAFDVYDAHVCSEAAPCFPPPAVVPPACSTSDSCKPAPSPQPSIFAPSGSATFSGAGNLAPPVSKPVAKAKQKSLTRAQKLTKALKVCRRHGVRKDERSACESRARGQYGTKVKANGKKSERRGK